VIDLKLTVEQIIGQRCASGKQLASCPAIMTEQPI